MRRIEIEIPLEPTGQVRMRRHPKSLRVYKPEIQQRRESQLLYYIMPHAPEVPWEGPVAIDLTAYLPMPKTWPKWKRDCLPFIMPTKTPDVDNILKQIKDVMNGLIYSDDKQVVRVTAHKCYGQPKWELLITELDGFRHDISKQQYAELSERRNSLHQ